MYNTVLNPKIWNENNTLKAGVKEAIYKIVKQFKDDLKNIPIEITDIRIVGSNASFNYNNHSDIDIHIVVNNEILPYDSKILMTLYNAYRNRFNREYSIKIKGLETELSIEDINLGVTSNGIYSVMNDQWVKFPTLIKETKIDMSESPSYKKLVQEIEQILNNPKSEDIKEMINRLYMIRKNSISIDGEYGQGNLLFKAIRNEGLLEKLKEKLYKILSKELTFESMMEQNCLNEALNYVED